MTIQIDAMRPRRQPGLLTVLRVRIRPLLHRTRRRPQSIHGLGDHLLRDIGLER